MSTRVRGHEVKGASGVPTGALVQLVEDLAAKGLGHPCLLQPARIVGMLTLSTSSLDWALNHAERFSNTGIFPLPFEFSAIRHDWDDVRPFLKSQDILDWKVRPNRECLSPKSHYGFRIATQLDPLDWLIYTALVYEIGHDIESGRLSKQEQVVFSWRFEPQTNGTMFDPQVGYGTFREKMRDLANRPDTQYVVVTDITDFYPRLGHHRVENALSYVASPKRNHSKAIAQLLTAWRGAQTFGLPVGPNASRLIAEIAINDIDQSLRGERLTFVRYVDDYRIFCKTKKDAHNALATLADVLWKNHGLTLAEQKTAILPVETFKRIYLRTEREAELTHLSESFAEIADQLGLDNWYQEIEYAHLDAEQKASVDALNLEGLLNDQLHRQRIDIPQTSFILRRFEQLQDANVANTILVNIDKLYPVFTDVMSYLDSLSHLSASDHHEIGKQLLNLMENSVASHLEYHRLHLLNLFATDPAWGNVDTVTALLSQFHDHFTQRKLILALGQSGRNYWFRQHKSDWQNYSLWERRALIRGASSLEADERRHWYNSIQTNLDSLERAVVSWSRQNPICP